MRFTLDHFDNDHAILRTNDAQELRISITDLPDGAEEGGVLDLGFHIPHTGDTTDPTPRAKDILNEILGDGHAQS